jgi:hypothetical protein
MLTEPPVRRGDKTGTGPSAAVNHDKSLLAETETISGVNSSIHVQASGEGVHSPNTHQVKAKCEHPSPQLVDYLKASQAMDPYTAARSAAAGNSERDTERLLKDWDEEWQKISAKNDV